MSQVLMNGRVGRTHESVFIDGLQCFTPQYLPEQHVESTRTADYVTTDEAEESQFV